MFFSRLHGQWPRSRRSFTLIEILAAMAVMEVMAVSVMMMFTFGNRSLTMIQEDMIVTNVLQAKVEEIKGQEFSKNVTATDVFMAPYTQYRLDVSQAT
ncbi:MAG: type II secretion system protein, partial [Candidatus Omnitrophota bacterium]|nr:type II secretion system protein [Candidatus Omnitrophota bacterium]